MRGVRFGAVALAVLTLAGCGGSAWPASPPVSLPVVERAAFTGKAVIEMVVTTKPGTSIRGENPDGSAAVESLSWGIEDPALSGGQHGRAVYDPVTLTRDVDSATPGLLSAAAVGQQEALVVFYLRPAAGSFSPDATTWPLRVTLSPAQVTSVRVTSAAAGAPQEMVTLAAGKVQFRYQPTGKAPVQTFSWNTVTNATG